MHKLIHITFLFFLLYSFYQIGSASQKKLLGFYLLTERIDFVCGPGVEE